MKKIFTLVGVTLCAMSANAQDVYNAIVDGKLATEFAAVAGEKGGVANNVADGKSIITMTAGKATVTAVGGTTPANADGGAQQITPGEVIDAEKHIYETASVEAWNDINWGLKNQGDIDFWYVTGTGNPYVKMNAVENSKDGEWLGTYKADYVYYNPDGSLGMPITGLYYKFTASAAGAFKVKVWANKGNRKTFVVNAKTQKAERLLASGYINGVNDADGKKKLLTVEQVDSVHHVYIWGDYEKKLAAGPGEGQTQEDFDAKMAELKAETEATEADRQFIRKVDEIIEHHLDDSSLSSVKISQEVCLGQRQLNRKMKAITGSDTGTYIRDKRILKAKKLLRATDKSIGEIQTACGFDSPSYFSKVFRDLEGTSPSEFRRQNM